MATDKVFKQHPELKQYFKTSDGAAFYKKEHASAHARSLKNRKVEEVKNTFETKAASDDTSENKLDELTPIQKAKLRANDILKLDTVEAVEEALKDETAKTVIAAGKQRIAELTNTNGKPTDEEE